MKRLNIVEENFLNTIKENNLINEGDKIVIGVSGGSDSITLLYLLNKYKNLSAKPLSLKVFISKRITPEFIYSR